jgi:hypothetical protein
MTCACAKTAKFRSFSRVLCIPRLNAAAAELATTLGEYRTKQGGLRKVFGGRRSGGRTEPEIARGVRWVWACSRLKALGWAFVARV